MACTRPTKILRSIQAARLPSPNLSPAQRAQSWISKGKVFLDMTLRTSLTTMSRLCSGEGRTLDPPQSPSGAISKAACLWNQPNELLLHRSITASPKQMEIQGGQLPMSPAPLGTRHFQSYEQSLGGVSPRILVGEPVLPVSWAPQGHRTSCTPCSTKVTTQLGGGLGSG